jgi:hypothetical protein
MSLDAQEIARRFPRTERYSPEWISENGFGGNALWQTEFLCERLELRPGMRVLDLGCGRAKSSVFLAREFEVEVWATDLWVPASENWQRIRDAGLEDQVFPIHANPTSPTFDVSACAATRGGPFFPLQFGFVEAAWEVQAKLFEKDSLVVAGLRDAAGADFVTVFGG